MGDWRHSNAKFPTSIPLMTFSLKDDFSFFWCTCCAWKPESSSLCGLSTFWLIYHDFTSSNTSSRRRSHLAAKPLRRGSHFNFFFFVCFLSRVLAMEGYNNLNIYFLLGSTFLLVYWFSMLGGEVERLFDTAKAESKVWEFIPFWSTLPISTFISLSLSTLRPGSSQERARQSHWEILTWQIDEHAPIHLRKGFLVKNAFRERISRGPNQLAERNFRRVPPR